VALTGWLIARRPTMSSGMKRLGSLLVFCGISAAVFGAIYGTVFGFHVNKVLGFELLPWAFDPLEDTGWFLALTIYIGIGILSLGILLNIFVHLRNRDVFHAIFSRTGLIGGVVYWGVVAIIIKVLAYEHDIGPWWILGFIVLPLVLFALRGPIWKLFNRRAKVLDEGLGMYAIETVMETFEIFTGFLANTMSFVRIAAYAFSHAGLLLAIFQIKGMLENTGPAAPVYQAIVVIIGNLVVIGLEGLVAGIQALRLEYYEFFSKFFRGGGKAFTPLGASGESASPSGVE
jgi:V/A-type H+-transporting ATPase subunit I